MPPSAAADAKASSSRGDVEAAGASARQSREGIVALLSALIRHPTFEPGQCLGAAPMVIEAMAALGFDIEEHYPPNAAGIALPTIIGWLGPRTARPDILLCAHMDTSPAGSGWRREPFGAERSGGLLFGRGAAVSKSDVATFIHAAAAVRREAGTIAVAVTSDEGSGGEFGAAWLLDHLKFLPGLAIFPGATDVVTIAHNGCVQVKAVITGTACHQSLVAPAEDAMRRATELSGRLYALADRLASRAPSAPGVLTPTLNITRITGGAEFGMAPREVEIWIDRRVAPHEQVDAAHAELIAVLEAATTLTGATLSHKTVRLAEPMRPAPSKDDFATCLEQEAALAFGKMLTRAGSTLYTDARWFSNAGIPTVMYGAGEADIRISGANGVDERVPELCLEQASVILARAMTRYLSEGQTR